MLEKFEIINGNMDMEFDSLVNVYTVSVDNDVLSLDYLYECSVENCILEEINNENLLVGINQVVINVTGDNYFDTYTFLVTKEESESVFYEIIIDNESLENSKLISWYETSYLIIFCVIILLITFKLMFFRKKR